MSKRDFVFALSAIFLTLSLAAEAQQPAKIPRIGYVSGSGSPSSPEPLLDALRQGLRKLGYTEGENISIEYRYAEEKLERVPILVDELVQLKVNVLVLPGLPAIRAAKQATTTIPIVFVGSADPVDAGLVDSLARPGGNLTGLASMTN